MQRFVSESAGCNGEYGGKGRNGWWETLLWEWKQSNDSHEVSSKITLMVNKGQMLSLQSATRKGEYGRL